jgi:hypothetical protein
MKKIFKIICGLVVLGALLFSASATLAVDPVSPSDVGSKIPTDVDEKAPFASQLATVLNVLLALASTVAVLFIIIGGYTYITSAGNPEQEKKAKSMIIGAVIGLIVILLSFAAVNFIDQLIS